MHGVDHTRLEGQGGSVRFMQQSRTDSHRRSSSQLAPIEESEDPIDRLLEYNPKFREQLASRLQVSD